MKTLNLFLISLFLLLSLFISESSAQSLNEEKLRFARNGRIQELINLLGDQPSQEELNEGLQMAISGNQLSIIRKLKKMGADINHRSAYGNHILINSIMFGHLQSAAYLVKLGSNPNASGYTSIKHGMSIHWNWTALMAAARQGDLKLIKLLIKKGADINNPGYSSSPKSPETPADIAAYSGHLEVLKYLLKKKNHISERSIFKAAAYGHIDVVEYLLNEGFDINRIGPDGKTLLMEAAWWGEFDMVKFLLESGAKPNITGKFGYTALSEAASHVNQGTANQVQIINLLIKHGADVNLHEPFHMSPLMRAVKANETEIIQTLVKFGAE